MSEDEITSQASAPETPADHSASAAPETAATAAKSAGAEIRKPEPPRSVRIAAHTCGSSST